MSIINAIKTYIATYASLATGAPLWVDYIGETPIEYNIVPVPASRIVETYINGDTDREYAFAFQSVASTADNLERLETLGFFEAFADWLESQSKLNSLPTLGTGQTPTKIEALSWGYLFQEGQSATGIYQIQCLLSYKQEN